MLLKIIMLISIMVMSYEIAKEILKNRVSERIKKYVIEKNEKYYENMIKENEKNKQIKIVSKMNAFRNISILIEQAGLSKNIFMNPVTVSILSIVIVCISYTIFFDFFRNIGLAVITSIPFIFLPLIMLETIKEIKQRKIEKSMLNFLLQLKTITKINNNIIYALREVKTVNPLNKYISQTNIEIKNGIKFEDAIENLKSKITIEKFRSILTNFQYCYIHGGDFGNMIDKNYKIISELQGEKERRVQETRGARIALISLILLNIVVYVSYIRSNYDNYMIMQNSTIGNVILYWNFISIWLLIFLSYNIKKLDY